MKFLELKEYQDLKDENETLKIELQTLRTMRAMDRVEKQQLEKTLSEALKAVDYWKEKYKNK